MEIIERVAIEICIYRGVKIVGICTNLRKQKQIQTPHLKYVLN